MPPGKFYRWIVHRFAGVFKFGIQEPGFWLALSLGSIPLSLRQADRHDIQHLSESYLTNSHLDRPSIRLTILEHQIVSRCRVPQYSMNQPQRPVTESGFLAKIGRILTGNKSISPGKNRRTRRGSGSCISKYSSSLLIYLMVRYWEIGDRNVLAKRPEGIENVAHATPNTLLLNRYYTGKFIPPPIDSQLHRRRTRQSAQPQDIDTLVKPNVK